MKEIKVNSSTIDSLSYDYDNHSLYVTFVNGRQYVYGNVPAETYAKFLEADSKGRFLRESIIGQYGYARLR